MCHNVPTSVLFTIGLYHTLYFAQCQLITYLYTQLPNPHNHTNAPSTTGIALIHVLRYEPLGLADLQQSLFLLHSNLYQDIALQAY